MLPLEFFSYKRRVFLAGGIRGCPDWQNEFIEIFNKLHSEYCSSVLLINPRREGDLAKDGEDALAQIKWEKYYLDESTVKLFWFPAETLCPITLFELGKYSRMDYKLVVGCDEDYQRKFDVKVQLELERGYTHISSNLEKLANQLSYVLS